MIKIIRIINENLKKSYLVVNKIYLFIIFIALTISNAALGFWYFIISIFIFIKKVLTSSIPMEVKEDIEVNTYTYKYTDNKELKMDIYYPNTYSDEYPLVYFCHGGGWISGFRDQPNNVSWCRFLASKGLAVASIDYRFGFKNNMLDLMSDYDDGLKYIRENKDDLKLDTSKIVLMGLSAGAHLSLLYSSFLTDYGDEKRMEGIRAVVAYYPPTDLRYLLDGDLNKSLFSKYGIEKTLEGSPSDRSMDIYEFYSPITWVSEDMIPVLLAHGREDKTVPFISSLEYAEKLKKYKIPYEFLIHDTGDHTFDTSLRDYQTINIIEKTVRFIKNKTK